MKSLKEELNSIGSDLLVMDVGPDEAFETLFKDLDHKPNLITFSRDYEPFAVKRDERLQKFFKKEEVECKTFRDHLIIEPWELIKKGSEDEGYQVYTPFSRMWRQIYGNKEIKDRVASQAFAMKYYKGAKKKIFSLEWKELSKQKDHLDSYITENKKSVTVDIPEAGTLAALKAVKSFKDRIKDYKDKRDIPSINGTSKLSYFFKNGSLTTAQAIHFLGLENISGLTKGEDGFLNELIWREFYYHILYRNPYVEKKAFKPAYENLKWENNKKWFEAWKNGMTGFPIVDAGMRQLKATGWMHNRVRMIVASFLVKDLLIDWRWGEEHFMKELLDGDLAPNNGGWQWAASTGCDAQPYFRIFNPWSQSKKFDPEGKYIKQFVPELKSVDSKKLHSPIEDHESYPSPIVEHSEQRELALKLYKSIK
jgi:deoxyribodipyrimidine photo-lyase